ncbi:trypsin-like [Musca domestica]|uniref:Trypsin-like n=1 Tax=Musca domestica TaxID=7370 RepID=A0ABM3V8I3_MUSDO|nr:trypsin-like [Musca domestica]
MLFTHSATERRRVVEVGAQPGDDNSKYYDVTSVIVHERYRLNDPNNDIALLVVNSTIPLSDKIRPVALPPIGSTVPGNNGRFVSFRRPGNSQKLQEFSVDYVNATVCQEMYGSIFNITEDMFCAGLSAGVGQTCQATPGMPLVGYSQNAPSTPVLYGITSFGVGSVMEGFPGLYVNVAAFRPWIDAKLRENGY